MLLLDVVPFTGRNQATILALTFLKFLKAHDFVVQSARLKVNFCWVQTRLFSSSDLDNKLNQNLC